MQLLTRHTTAHREQPLPGGLQPGLARARVHEICGPARVAFALMILQMCDGPVIWISPSWLPERLYPCGVAEFIDPGRLIFARCRRPEDIQWCAEEGLRAGAAPVVVAEMPSPPALTPVRRLHLSAETGREAAHHAGRPAPLGLLLTAGDGGAQGVESRWHMAAAPTTSALTEDAIPMWTLQRRRARNAPPAEWDLAKAPGTSAVAKPAQG